MKFGQKALLSGALVGAAVAGGAVGASVLGTAQAQTSSSSSTAATSDPSTAADANHGPHVANGITETPLTGDDLSKATAAAQAAVPGATIERAETDAEGAAFEVHVTKADGSEATVKLDASFNVTSIEDGRA
jgi:uncharacterized membrane protein YkoI